jgi:hypothetical protein
MNRVINKPNIRLSLCNFTIYINVLVNNIATRPIGQGIGTDNAKPLVENLIDN